MTAYSFYAGSVHQMQKESNMFFRLTAYCHVPVPVPCKSLGSENKFKQMCLLASNNVQQIMHLLSIH